ncbi:geranylgeranyl reductase family protein [Methanosphaera sp. WGK6]|uniref:geranylgeranyl reductase family protein n=1 Tax=Methanosphaera sp. WGK6 TaxID=1561964 RepID=UPI00084BE36E|nr:geranylgeranyl reductase family protein [Methanosphaera sp. WGK6]OED30620.1 hypothetical protein NL43_01370 [Methanosphaera sp. WGK6]
MKKYDIIVVGAGPIGSTYAYKMAKLGYDVGLFDMKNRIGQPLQCAGIVSTNINDTKNLPKEFIDNQVKGANLISPDSTSITVEKEDTVAYVLDRVMYDKYLFERAVDAGVDAHLGERVFDVDINNTSIKTDREYSSRLITVSCGPNSSTSKKMNPNLTDESFMGIQYTVKTELTSTDYVDVNVNSSILPGFVWKIPVSPTEQRIGLFTQQSYNNANQILMSMIDSKSIISQKHYGSIPKYNFKKNIVENNTILLGDSASQVKPTTGGGLIAGFNCVDIAVNNSNKMLEEENNKYLENYQKEYHKKYGNEFRAQQNVQSIIQDMTEDDFNYMFKQLKENHVDEIISEYGDMDNQTPLLKQLVKTGIIFKLLPKIGLRRLKNIWKSQ